MTAAKPQIIVTRNLKSYFISLRTSLISSLTSSMFFSILFKVSLTNMIDCSRHATLVSICNGYSETLSSAFFFKFDSLNKVDNRKELHFLVNHRYQRRLECFIVNTWASLIPP